MNQLLVALGDNVKKTGKNWSARCPVHEGNRFNLSITQTRDGTILMHCHACGANGVMVYRSLGLNLDELFGNKEKDKNYISQRQRDEYENDKFYIAIYEADKGNGKIITHNEFKRYRLAISRVNNLKGRI